MKLTPNPLNPRQITDEKLAMLKASLLAHGDLSGIVLNRRTGHLVGGHQRCKVFEAAGNNAIIHKTPVKKSKDGTVAYGYVMLDGIQFVYREVNWPAEKEQVAMIAANAHGGEWIDDQLAKLLADLKLPDMTLTGFTAAEISALLEAQKPDVTIEQARQTLAERFGVPPFSVLDARQGYWQDRKRAWLALGIQSEIGRGSTPATSARAKPGDIPTYRQIGNAATRQRGNSESGGDEETAKRQARLSPGGSARPACDYSKRQRGDGAGKPIV